LKQSPPTQSATTWQVKPLAHFPQEPPQSTSDSVPFFTLSSQLGARQRPAVQTPESQSEAAEQC
jgi:hypothetical protein